MRMKTATYRRRRPYRGKNSRTGILAAHAAICLAGFFVLFGLIWFSFGPFETLRASGWPMASAQKMAAATTAPPSVLPSASAQPLTQPIASAPAALAYVQVKDIAQGNYKGKLMLVSDPSAITVGVTPYLGDVGVPLSRIVKDSNAAGGVNAGSFEGYNGNGGVPEGIVIADAKTVYQQNDQTAFQITGFNTANKLTVSAASTLAQIGGMNLRCAVSAGPLIVENGKAVAVADASVDPRTAIGQTKDGTVLLLVIDGRSADSEGVDFKTLSQIMIQNGAEIAAALDGGSSATMDYLGKTLNNPCNISGERSIATAFLVMPGGNNG